MTKVVTLNLMLMIFTLVGCSGKSEEVANTDHSKNSSVSKTTNSNGQATKNAVKKSAQTIDESIAAIRKVGGKVILDRKRPGNPVRLVLLRKTAISNSWLVHLKPLSNVEGVHLSSTSVSDPGLAFLSGFAELKSLSLNNTSVTDAGLVHLKGLTKLKEINLYGTKVTDAGAQRLNNWVPGCKILRSKDPKPKNLVSSARTREEAIAALKKLRGTQIQVDENLPGKPVIKLHLGGPWVGNSELANVEKLPDLQNLSLMATDVTGAGLIHLKGLTNLKSLRLGLNLKIKRPPLSHLSKLMSLESLSLVGIEIEDSELVHLEGLKLRKLFINGTKIGDAGLAHIKALTTIDTLKMDDTKITDSGLVHLKPLTNLTYLNIDDTKVAGSGLFQLAGLTKLKSLWLPSEVDDAAVKKLKNALPNCNIYK